METTIENSKPTKKERTDRNVNIDKACVPSKKTKEDTFKTVSQDEIAREISAKFGVTLELVSDIITEEQKATMRYVANGYRVVKKNFLTLSLRTLPERTFTSPLDKKVYLVSEKKLVRVRVGEGFTDFCNSNIKAKKEPMCKFVKRTDK
jgi:nucleoid DNA-binding protein